MQCFSNVPVLAFSFGVFLVPGRPQGASIFLYLFAVTAFCTFHSLSDKCYCIMFCYLCRVSGDAVRERWQRSCFLEKRLSDWICSVLGCA